MEVTIKITSNEALALQQKNSSPDVPGELLQAIEELGVALKPLHPGAKDPDLFTYFKVEVQNFAEAERAVNRLSRCQNVEAAYLKPADELP